MALTKTVTKMFPTAKVVGIHLKLEDDDRLDLDPTVGMKHIVIDKDFSESFTKGEGATTAVKQAIGKKAQAAIDEYKEARAMFVSATYETARTQIDGALTL